MARFTAAESGFAACHRLADALLPAHRLRLLLHFAQHDPEAALAVPLADLRGPHLGLTEKQATRLRDAAAAPLPPRFRETAQSKNAFAVTDDSPLYPAPLLPLSDSPPLLFVRGTLPEGDGVAIVGSRRATIYGRQQAERFARAFAENGFVVVSGGAAGIDTAAHRAAINAGGKTVAVLGCGVDVVYPAENRGLFEEIAATGGALLSEFPLGTKPEPWRFPSRNRIIAGMGRVTLVVETPRDSGALITARCAAEYGRDVWAVPGPVEGGRSKGGHKLIQDGAGLADAPEDVLFALGIDVENPAAFAPPVSREASAKTMVPPPSPSLFPDPAPPSPAPLPPLSPDEAALFAQFDAAPRHRDEAGREANLSASQTAIALTLLEMKNLLEALPGGVYKKASPTG